MLRTLSRLLLSVALFMGGIAPIIEQNSDLFVSDYYDGKVVHYDGNTGAFIDVFVTPGSGGLSEADGIVVGPDNNLYVSSHGSSEVLRYDGTTGAFLDAFVPVSSGGLSGPFGLVFGPDGNLYVDGAFNSACLRYNGATGAFINTFTSGYAPYLAHGNAFGPDGNLYLVDYYNEVVRFNGKTGKFLNVFASNSALSTPSALCFGPDGNLYVTGYYDGAVLRFNGRTGAYIDTFVPSGTAGLDGAEGVLFGPDLNLYVASTHGPGAVLKFDGKTGAYIGVFASGGGLTNPTQFTFRPAIVYPIALNLSSYSIPGSLTDVGHVILNAPAPPGGVKVTLTNTNSAATVPGSLVFAGGQTIKGFTIKTSAVTSAVTGTVTATYYGVSQSVSLMVRPIGVKVLTLSPTSVTGGNSVTGTVTLEAPAAPGDITVSLVSNYPSVANPTVSSITIPAGSKTGTFTVATNSVSTATTVKIFASANGTTRSAKLTVNP